MMLVFRMHGGEDDYAQLYVTIVNGFYFHFNVHRLL